MDLRAFVRTIPDHPLPDIQFRDITTLLLDPDALRVTVHRMAESWRRSGVDLVAGIEARGFILGGAVAVELGVGFVPIRKAGKLPGQVRSQEYSLEYGTDTVEMHVDAVAANHRVLLVDDLIATGGTALAGVELLRGSGAEVVGAAFVIDLPDLGGAARLAAADVDARSLIAFAGE